MLPWHCCRHGCLIEAASFIGPQPGLPACWCRHRQCHAPACEAASGLLHDTKQLVVPGRAATGACPAAAYGQHMGSKQPAGPARLLNALLMSPTSVRTCSMLDGTRQCCRAAGPQAPALTTSWECGRGAVSLAVRCAPGAVVGGGRRQQQMSAGLVGSQPHIACTCRWFVFGITFVAVRCSVGGVAALGLGWGLTDCYRAAQEAGGLRVEP
jgi:hypothetical protein